MLWAATKWIFSWFTTPAATVAPQGPLHPSLLQGVSADLTDPDVRQAITRLATRGITSPSWIQLIDEMNNHEGHGDRVANATQLALYQNELDKQENEPGLRIGARTRKQANGGR